MSIRVGGDELMRTVRAHCDAGWGHTCPEQTTKMTKPVLKRESVYYIGITSQFLDCRVGGEGEREERQRGADRRALAPVMD